MNGGTNPEIALTTALALRESESHDQRRDQRGDNGCSFVCSVPYMESYSAAGSGSTDAQMMAYAFTMAAELANTGTGSSPGVGVPTGQTVSSQKLNTLANIVSACINSNGGRAGDQSLAGSCFFSLQRPAALRQPTPSVPCWTLPRIQPAMWHRSSTWIRHRIPFSRRSPLPPPTGLEITSSTPTPVLSPSPGTYATIPAHHTFRQQSFCGDLLHCGRNLQLLPPSRIPGHLYCREQLRSVPVAIVSGISSVLATERTPFRAAHWIR